MSIEATYDSDLARVRLTVDAGGTGTGVGGADGTFEVDAADWTGFDCTVTRSSEQAHTGTYSGKLTVTGSPTQAYSRPSVSTAVTPGEEYTLDMWLYSAAGFAGAAVSMDWYDSGFGYLSTAAETVALPAGAWTHRTYAAVAPVGAAFVGYGPSLTGSPAGGTVIYFDDVLLLDDSAGGGIEGVAAVTIERSAESRPYAAVRGGREKSAPSGTAQVDDYEFAPGVLNTYRVTYLSDVGVSLGTETVTVTPTIDRVWLKSVARPFLNMPITVQDYTAITRRSRAGLFEIPGRSFPVRVGDVPSSAGWTLQVLTRTLAEKRALEFLVASGDVVLVQVPPEFDIPGGYVGLGDMNLGRVSRTLTDDRRLFSLPMTEVAAPAESVVGYAATWAGLIADFGSWAAVLAAFPTWADLLEYVADPETVIVP